MMASLLSVIVKKESDSMENQLLCLFTDFRQANKHGCQLLKSVMESSLYHLIKKYNSTHFITLITFHLGL
jgi:hypothetical protein